MSWTKFFYIIIGIYTFYYLIIIVIDSLKNKDINDPSSQMDELTFQEDIEPENIKPEITAAPTTIEKLAELENVEEIGPAPAKVVWERQDEDTEEITLVSHNTNTSTGGTTQMSELIRLAQNNTINYKNSLVFY
ncbi:hypothetical protein [Mucilaginibacter arboris]|uniref:Uncharacterized protein n=1 Tax=Mucilaginibacter arboris TaxID=2682090 RepID=A0A7K1T0D1_9SPHI|nr:hypothetical protein [Mucilaginibacter arboris]MVN23031.1 hypothetical protein [Mucilaginibacter arboris]